MKTALIRDCDTHDGTPIFFIEFNDNVDGSVIEEAIRKSKQIDGYDSEDLREQIELALGDDLISCEYCPSWGDYEYWW